MTSAIIESSDLKGTATIHEDDNEKAHHASVNKGIDVSVEDVELTVSAPINDKFIRSKFGCLEGLDQLCIKKGIKLGLAQTEVLTEIYDNMNQKLFQAREQIEQSCSGCCYSPDRWLDMNVINSQDEEILHLSRDKGTCCAWVSCNLPTMEIFLSPKYMLGKMKGVTGIYPVKYNIEDESGQCLLKIRSGFSFPYLYFNILSNDKSSIIGKISRERPSSHHVFSRYYSVHLLFPVDLNLKTKIILLGAALLLMSSHFEESE